MAALAIYEEEDGRRDREPLSYYRSDYVALKMIGTALATTVGYVLTLGLIAAGNAEALLEMIGSGNVAGMITTVVMLYAALMVIYLAGTFISARKRVKQAEERIRQYREHLETIKKLM